MNNCSIVTMYKRDSAEPLLKSEHCDLVPSQVVTSVRIYCSTRSISKLYGCVALRCSPLGMLCWSSDSCTSFTAAQIMRRSLEEALNGLPVDTATATTTPVFLSTEKPNPCDSVSCFNGGSCIIQSGADSIIAAFCNCTSRFVGDFCQFRDPCVLKSSLSRRCYNGGTCKIKYPKTNSTNAHLGRPTYECACRPGHIGPNCASFDYCAIAPCQKGTTCRNLDNGYTCDCPRGYRGTDCKLDVDECAMEEPCQNDGICVNTMGSYRCICPRDFKGPKCEEVYVPCSINPCKNGGVCCPGVNSTHLEHCDCPSGFAGRFCEENINDCPGHSCQNGGKCIDQVDGYVCECPAGYEGQFCTDDVNECLQIPTVCKNGGVCLNRVGNFSCTCPKGWEGAKCDVIINNACLASPCKPWSTCIPSATSPDIYTCACPYRWTGKHCHLLNPCYDNSCPEKYLCMEVLHPTLPDLISPSHRCEYYG